MRGLDTRLENDHREDRAVLAEVLGEALREAKGSRRHDPVSAGTEVRLLGPLVVVFTLELLGSGVLMIILGPQTSREGIVPIVGHPLSLVSLHAGLAVCWAVVTGFHARTTP